MADAFINDIGSTPELTVSECFFDSDLTTLDSVWATGEPTVDMQSKDIFEAAGWELDSVWFLAGSYPVLEGTPPGPPKLLIRYRNDGKAKWSAYREINLGSLGDTEIMKRISGLGSYRTRQYEIVSTSGVPITIAGIEEAARLGGVSGK